MEVLWRLCVTKGQHAQVLNPVDTFTDDDEDYTVDETHDLFGDYKVQPHGAAGPNSGPTSRLESGFSIERLGQPANAGPTRCTSSAHTAGSYYCRRQSNSRTTWHNTPPGDASPWCLRGCAGIV